MTELKGTTTPETSTEGGQSELSGLVSTELVTVVRWTNWDESENLTESYGGLGGFFQNGMRWSDYLDALDECSHKYAEAIRAAVVNDGIKATGAQHQGGNLVPVFNDGTCATFSFRGWGDLMAAIWSEEEGRDYCYIDFYC